MCIPYDLAHVVGWEPYDGHDLARFPGLNLDPVQDILTADMASTADDLDDLSDASTADR